jgi:flagellar basal-body rod protein FlgF
MDRLIYVAMTGAQQLLQQQSVTTHNLANASTPGFKAELAAFRAAPLVGPGAPTRAYALATTTGADLAPGSIQRTGRDLDVAVDGPGFLAVQARDGTEAYTRHGSLQLSPDGEITTHDGRTVLGDGGPIIVPAEATIEIARDGTVSATTQGAGGATTTTIGRLKLVNPEARDVVKGNDGLFRLRNGATADADPAVMVLSGALEGSNVNAVSAMVDMIGLARQFDMQMKLLQSAQDNEQRASQLLANGAG